MVKFFVNIVFAIAGNKCDCYEYEEVDEDEGRNLANEYNAIFQLTSAKYSYGVEDLFKKIGEKFLFPNGAKKNIYHEEIEFNPFKYSAQNGVSIFKSLYKYIDY